MTAILFSLGALIIGLVVLKGLMRTNPAVLARRLRNAAGTIALAGAAALVLRGGILLAAPLAAIGFMLLFGTRSPLFGLQTNRRQPATGQTSRIVTDTLEMELDLETGAIRGRVLKGVCADQAIECLSPAELVLLWRDCRLIDPKSAKLIEAYLDRAHPGWQEDMARADTQTAGGVMTREEALAILGLKSGASIVDIRAAHRDLMKKLHPDRGGSDYLASKINEAKDALIGK